MIKCPMVQDIAEKHFWDKIPFLKPYALLARWDRPIGFWLLYWPCIWGLTLAPSFKTLEPVQQIKYALLFLIGAIAMRGAGCTLNDLYDRKLDAQVERTKQRPLASGAIKPTQAIIFMILQLIVGAMVLLQLSDASIFLGMLTIPLIATYPLMKRITWWPQAFLGLNFNSGALIGWAAVEGSISWPPVLLYFAGICWTIAYDTVYAHMDVKDDILIGVKSTAVHWGLSSKLYIGWFWIATLAFFSYALILADANWVSFFMLGLGGAFTLTAHIFWPPDNGRYSLRFFRLQHQIGMLWALATLAPTLF